MSGTMGLSALMIVLSVASQASQANPPDASKEKACVAGIRQDAIKERSRHGEVIQDPGIGLSWRVERDPLHPARPRRLIELPDAVPCGQKSIGRIGTSERTEALNAEQRWVIRKGNVLLVSQDTKVVHARLTAVALGNGMIGDPIDVRLRFASKVLRARITGPGRGLLIDGGGEMRR